MRCCTCELRTSHSHNLCPAEQHKIQRRIYDVDAHLDIQMAHDHRAARRAVGRITNHHRGETFRSRAVANDTCLSRQALPIGRCCHRRGGRPLRRRRRVHHGAGHAGAPAARRAVARGGGRAARAVGWAVNCNAPGCGRRGPRPRAGRLGARPGAGPRGCLSRRGLVFHVARAAGTEPGAAVVPLAVEKRSQRRLPAV